MPSMWNCQKWTVLLRTLPEMRQTSVKIPRWVYSSAFIESAETVYSILMGRGRTGHICPVPWKSWVLFPCLDLFHGNDRSQQNVNKVVDQFDFETKLDSGCLEQENTTTKIIAFDNDDMLRRNVLFLDRSFFLKCFSNPFIIKQKQQQFISLFPFEYMVLPNIL